MPVLGFNRNAIIHAPFSHMTFRPANPAALATLRGPTVFTIEEMQTHLNKPQIPNPRLDAFRTWHQSVAPLSEHKDCLPGHHFVTTTIPMGEVQFLREKYPSIPPQTPVGSISLSLCHQKGTRLRIDLMDHMYDLELTAMANQYTIITGPVTTGYYVFVYLHDKEECKCLIAYAHLSSRNEIRIEYRQVVGGFAEDRQMGDESELVQLDGGILI